MLLVLVDMIVVIDWLIELMKELQSRLNCGGEISCQNLVMNSMRIYDCGDAWNSWWWVEVVDWMMLIGTSHFLTKIWNSWKLQNENRTQFFYSLITVLIFMKLARNGNWTACLSFLRGIVTYLYSLTTSLIFDIKPPIDTIFNSWTNNVNNTFSYNIDSRRPF